jgi:hypothetical protein
MAGFKFDISKFLKLQAIVGSPSGAAIMKPLYEAWGTRYLSFARAKFTENSRGGGDWPALATSTMNSRMRKTRRTKKGRHLVQAARAMKVHGLARSLFFAENLNVAILRDTGTLLRGLNVDAPGNLFKTHAFGIKVGYGGGAAHPKGPASIAQIAAYHNEGGGRLPKRQIIYPPDAGVKQFMLSSLRSHITNVVRSL